MAEAERNGRKCWSRSEDKALRSAVSRRGPHRWAHVAGEPGLEMRTPKSCRLRWLNHLNPTVVKEQFREEESRAVALGYVRFGSRWSSIARELRGRTDSAVKNHWNNYLRQRYGRLLSDILQNPQVSDIRAAAAFGVGPSMLKAAITNSTPPSAQNEDSKNPASECVSGHVTQSTEGSEGENHALRPLLPDLDKPPPAQGLSIRDLVSQDGVCRIREDAKLTPFEEMMGEREPRADKLELLNAARNQMNMGSVRSWTRSDGLNQTPLDMFALCRGFNNATDANHGTVQEEEVHEPDMRRLNTDTTSTTMFSSCSNTFGHANQGYENPAERNIRSSGNSCVPQGGNTNYGFPDSLALRNRSQSPEVSLYRDSLSHAENNGSNNLNSSTAFPSHNSNRSEAYNSLEFQVSHSGGVNSSRGDSLGGEHLNPVSAPLINLNVSDPTLAGVGSGGMGGFSGQPFVTTAKIVPSSGRRYDLFEKHDEGEILSHLAETFLTMFNGDIEATRQFLENMSEYQRSQI